MKPSLLRAWLLASRPKTLPAAIVPIWGASVLSWKLQGSVSVWLTLCILAATLLIQIATNLFNDAIDAEKGADTAQRLGPQRATASGWIPRQQVMIAAAVCLFLALVLGAILVSQGGWPIALIGLISLYLAYGYTGGAFPLAYRGMGELFVVLFFGIIAVSGSVYLQTGHWRDEAVLLGFQIGLLSAVLISINNLRDREEDAKSGKNTLAVRLGDTGGRVLIWLEIKVAALAALLWFKFSLPWLAMATLPLWTLGFFLLWKIVTGARGKALNSLLAIAALQLLLFALCLHAAALWL